MVAVAQSGQWAVQLTPGQSGRRFGLSDPTDVGSRAELDGQSGLARRAVGRGFPTDGRTVASRQRTVELVRRADARDSRADALDSRADALDSRADARDSRAALTD